MSTGPKVRMSRLPYMQEKNLDPGYSNHMTGDKREFIKSEKYDGESVSFASKGSTPICDKGTVSIDGKHKAVISITLLRQNLLNVSQLCGKGLS